MKSRLVGEGGMGQVYRARDTRLDRMVAIKVLPRRSQPTRIGATGSSARRGPSRRSIIRTSARCIDVGDQDGVDFLVLEYLEGETLARAPGRGPLPARCECAADRDRSCDALDKRIAAGIVHRDLKPANVMLTRAAGFEPASPSCSTSVWRSCRRRRRPRRDRSSMCRRAAA